MLFKGCYRVLFNGLCDWKLFDLYYCVLFNSNSLSLPVSGLHEKRSVIPPALVPIPAGRTDALEKSETKSSKNS